MQNILFNISHKITVMTQQERIALSTTILAFSMLFTLLLLHAVRPVQQPVATLQSTNAPGAVANVEPEPIKAQPKKVEPSKLSVYASNIKPCKPFKMTFIDAYGKKKSREIEGIVPAYNTCAFTEELPYGGLMTCWIKTDEQYAEVTDYYTQLDKNIATADDLFEPLIANGTCEVTGYTLTNY